MFDNLCRFVEFFRPVAANSCGRLVKDLLPFPVLLFRDFSHGKAERSQAFGGVIFEVLKSNIHNRIVLGKTLKYDRVCSFTIDSDLPIGTSKNGRHALPCGIEFTDSKELILKFLATNLDDYSTRFSSHKLVPQHSRAFHKSTLVWGSGLIFDLTLFIFTFRNHCMAGRKHRQKVMNGGPTGVIN